MASYVGDASRDSLLAQFRATATQQGITPERAMYDYALANNIGLQDVNTYMGYQPGTAENWAANNINVPAPAPAPVPAPVPITGPAAPLSDANKAGLLSQFNQTAAQQGISPERAMYDYAKANNIGLQDVNTYMGYAPGTAESWAALNATGPSQTTLPPPAKVARTGIPPPPTFDDVLNPYNKWHQQQYGTIIERPWASDADSRAAKKQLDAQYQAQIQAYNDKYGTDVVADPKVLGETAQPNDYSRHRNSSGGFISDTISHWGKVVANDPALMAAITVAGSALGVPPQVTAAVLGANRTGQDGNLLAGVETGLLSLGLGTGVDNLINTGSITGVSDAALASGGSTTAGTGTTAGTVTGMGGGTGVTVGGSNLPVAAGMGGGTGLTAAGAALPTAAGMGGGTGLMAGGTVAAGTLAGTTAGTVAGTTAGTLANTVAGTTAGSLIPAVANIAGGLLNQQAASDAAKTQADAQIRAAQIAADAAKFKPVGVTTGFGSSNFGYDANGNLISAGYTKNPQVQAAQDQLAGTAPGLLNQFTGSQAATAPMGQAAASAMALGQNQLGVGQNMLNTAQQWNPNIDQLRAQTAGMQTGANASMNLGNQYLATSPQAQAAKYMADQQGLLAPGRAAEMAALQSQMQAQGRGGFAIGGGVNGQMASNPQMQALYNARMQQDAQLAAQSTQGGMDYAKFGAGMVGTGGDLMKSMYGTQAAAYDPYKTAIGIGQGQANFGIGAVGAGGDLLSSMYGTQTAAYSPFNTALSGIQTLEGMGQNAMDQGIRLGSATTAANTNAGSLLASGMTGAANTIGNQAQQAGSMWGNLLQGGANTFERYNQPQGTNYDPTKYRLTPL